MAALADGRLIMSDEMELVETGIESEEVETGGGLSELPGIGPKTAEKLISAGITSVEQLASMSAEELAALPGLGLKTAEKILSSLQD